jgi:hypothetical protein
MNARSLFLTLSCLPIFAIYSCSSTSNNAANDSVQAKGSQTANSDSSNKALQLLTNQKTAEFVLTSIEKGDEDPRSVITASYSHQEIIIDTIMGSAQYYPKENWKEMDVPENAISVCGCWWAGGGDYFYMIPTEKGVAIYVGYQDEGQEEPGYGWTLKKEISE